MSGEYRDELSAAHARIAELEEKVRTLEDEAKPERRFTGLVRFPELEAKIAAYAAGADPIRGAKRRMRLTWIGAAFPLLGMMFTFAHQPILATFCSVGFIALMLVNLLTHGAQKKYERRLHELQHELQQAQRVAALEAELAATRQVRVADDSVQTAAIEEDEAQEPLRAERV